MQAVPLPVAVGVVTDGDGRVLVGQRASDAVQGGLWEFPGGKVEVGELPFDALRRELEEETGIHVSEARPLIRIRHQYTDYAVDLHVWHVTSWQGEVAPRLGQPLRWLNWRELDAYPFLDANALIVAAARLPSALYAIVPVHRAMQRVVLLGQFERAVSLGAGILQLRGDDILDTSANPLLLSAVDWCRSQGIPLVMNTTPERAMSLGADGVHLNSMRLMSLMQRPVPRDFLMSVACHDEAELAQAAKISADCALLGAVASTRSHPGQQVLGWETFERMILAASVPVYALGGVALSDITMARASGAVGIAGISAFQ